LIKVLNLLFNLLELNAFDNGSLILCDNKVLKVQFDMLIFGQVCRTIN